MAEKVTINEFQIMLCLFGLRKRVVSFADIEFFVHILYFDTVYFHIGPYMAFAKIVKTSI